MAGYTGTEREKDWLYWDREGGNWLFWGRQGDRHQEMTDLQSTHFLSKSTFMAVVVEGGQSSTRALPVLVQFWSLTCIETVLLFLVTVI